MTTSSKMEFAKDAPKERIEHGMHRDKESHGKEEINSVREIEKHRKKEIDRDR